MRIVRDIIIHCSATKPGQDIGAKEIREWHTAKGWQDIGYHRVIRRNGLVEMGRDDEIAGAHVEGHNADSIGICMVGGIDNAGRPESNFTAAQWRSLFAVVTDYLAKYPRAVVTGHNNWTDKKACPSFNARVWWYGQ